MGVNTAIVCLAFGLFAPAQQTAPTVLDIEALLEAVRKQSPALAVARANITVAERQVQSAWAGWKPNLQASGALTYNSLEATFDQGAVISDLAMALGFDPSSLGPLPPPVVIQPHLQLVGALQLSQTLFNIAVLRAPGVAKAAMKASAAQADALEDELLFQGVTLYASLGGLAALDAAAERAIQVAKRRVVDAKALVEAGSATQLDITRAETDRAVAEGERVALRAQRKRLLASLRALVGTEKAIEVSREPLGLQVDTGTKGYVDRRSIKASRLQLKAAEQAIGLVSMGWLPSLQAQGRLQYTNFEGFAGERFLASATLSLVIPLYDGGQRYADLAVAEARAEVARRSLAQARLSARAFWEQARADLEAATAELSQAQAQLALANAAVKQAEELVAGGLATALELADVDGRRFRADRLVAQKKLSLELARLRVFYAAGGRL